MDMKEVMKGCKNKLERIAFLKDNCNKVIDEELEEIKEIAPNIAILEE